MSKERHVSKKFILMFMAVISLFFKVSLVSADKAYTDVNSAEELILAIKNNENVRLTSSFELSETVKMTNQDITLDLNGYTITGKDNNTTGNFNLFENLKGNFTIIDSKGNGQITLVASTNRYWDASSNIIDSRGATTTIEAGILTHLGGTDMTYVINVNANSYGATTLNVKGGELYAPYTAIRLFMDPPPNGGLATLNVTGGFIDGGTSAIWAQAASSKNGQLGEINIEAGDIGVINTARSTTSVVSTTISGGTVESIKSEAGELKITGGHIEGVLTILTSEGATVTNDQIITGGTFDVEPTGFIASTVNVTSTITANGETVYAIGSTSVAKMVKNAKKGDVVTINGNIEITDVKVGVIVNVEDNSTVKINGNTVPEEGLTVPSTIDANIPQIDSDSNVDVGVKNPTETSDILLETIENILKGDNTQDLATTLYNYNTKIEINVSQVDGTTIDEGVISEMQTVAGNSKIVAFFDISILLKKVDSDETIGSLDTLNREIELMILLPEELRSDTGFYYLVRKHEDKIDRIEATLSEDGKYLIFRSNQFSTYALVYEEIPETIDELNYYILFINAALFGLAIIGLKSRKKSVRHA